MQAGEPRWQDTAERVLEIGKSLARIEDRLEAMACGDAPYFDVLQVLAAARKLVKDLHVLKDIIWFAHEDERKRQREKGEAKVYDMSNVKPLPLP